MRSLKLLPFTRVRSTPSSRANLRPDGPACACEKPGSLIGGRVGLDAAAAGASDAAGAAAFADDAASATGAAGFAGGELAAVGFVAAGAAGGDAGAGAAAPFGESATAPAGSSAALTVAMRSPVDTVPPL